MQHYQKLQAYVPPHIADWIRQKAHARQASFSIAIRDLLVDAWHRECDDADRPAGNDPERQRVFATVALDALLTHHDDPTLRTRTIAAYHRRLARLGLIAAPVEGDDDDD